MTIKIFTGDFWDYQCDALCYLETCDLRYLPYIEYTNQYTRIEREIGYTSITTIALTNALYLIKSIAPKWHNGTMREAELLEKCYESIFKLIHEYEIRSVLILDISGADHFPIELAAQISTKVAHKYDTSELTINLVCNDDVAEVYYSVLNQHFAT